MFSNPNRDGFASPQCWNILLFLSLPPSVEGMLKLNGEHALMEELDSGEYAV